MAKQFIFFIIGLPCSGKSSIAEYLCERYDCVHLSTEQIRANILGINHEDVDCDFTVQQQGEVYDKINEEFDCLLKNAKSVIVDGVYRSIRRRNEIFEIASRYVSLKNVFAYCITCDEGVAKQRLVDRKKKGTVAPAGVKGYQKIKSEFEQVDSNMFVEIDNTGNLYYAINTIISDIEKRVL